MDSGTVSSTTPSGPAGFGAYDMGARRYGPDMGSFFQADAFNGALADLGLALDPLTQNRYALAGGNPISYIETDGHMVDSNGGGGDAAGDPNPKDDDFGSRLRAEWDKEWNETVRFGKTAGKDVWEGVTGTYDVVATSLRCEHGNNTEGCDEFNDELKRQYTTKEGWKETWHAAWDPIHDDCTSKERVPECAGHIGAAVFEAVVGRGIGRATHLPNGSKHLPDCHSFAPGTLVLLADGTTKPIEEVEIGDEVVTTDPETGETTTRKVTALHNNQDRDLTDVVVRADDGTDQTLHTTQRHPFWSVTRQAWVDAAKLTAGELLRTSGARAVVVLGVTSFAGGQRMRDLTVEDLHTYYVVAGQTSVLVHNTQPCLPGVGDVPRKVVNTNMGHVDAERAERAGFSSVQEARSAVRDLGKSIETNGFPEGTIPDTVRSDRVLVPFGQGGYVVYQIKPNGNAVFKTILEQRP